SDDLRGSEHAAPAVPDRPSMNARPNDARASDAMQRPAGKGEPAASRSAGRKQVGSRDSQYMIIPARPGLAVDAIIRRVGGEVEILRTLTSQVAACPPVVVVRMAQQKAEAFGQSAVGTALIEPDEPLRTASAAGLSASAAARTTMTSALGSGFTTT